MAVLPAAVQASSSVPDSPVIRQDLARFDQAFGLPAPSAFTIFFRAEAFRDITLGSNSL